MNETEILILTEAVKKFDVYWFFEGQYKKVSLVSKYCYGDKVIHFEDGDWRFLRDCSLDNFKCVQDIG